MRPATLDAAMPIQPNVSRGPDLRRRARGWRRHASAGVLACGLVLTGTTAPCGEGPPVQGGGTGRQTPNAGDPRRAEVRFPRGRLFVAEMADTPHRTQEGYMFRREVKENEAMIFVFPETDFHPFWMKNTLVSLDMIWMDDDFMVIHIEPSVPPCKADPCASYGPPRKSRYVLEVRGGTTAREGLKVGERLRILFPQSVE
jgi:uncharacterized protein